MCFKKEKYIDVLTKNSIFENGSNLLPQTVVAEIIEKHFLTAKNPKAIILGFDGARADSMIFASKNSRYSAINELTNNGGLYLSYAGGEKNSPQETSTAQGWASILTGEWGGVNGVLKHKPLNKNCPTILRKLAENGTSSCFLAQWDDHFTITYKDEISIVNETKIPFDIKQFKNDEEMHKSIISHIDDNTACIFAIYEAPDYAGHETGFTSNNCNYVIAVKDLDLMAYEVIEHIKSRQTYETEDWLMLITSDHGGHKRGHGTQKDDDRMTFIVSNKKINNIEKS